jgi:co-chaperonin GroES (HSP10)
MRTYNFFVVEIEKTTQDTMVTESGLELYIDTRFNEFEHRTQSGKVIAVPFKHDHGVKVGDELYFHHRVVLQEGQALTGYDNHYLVSYHENDALECQAIAYKCKDTGEIHPLSSWHLIEQIQEERDEKSDSLELVEFKKKPITKGKICFETKFTKELNVKPGDTVVFMKNHDYDVLVDGKSYGRVPTQSLLYVEEEVHND